ncbi:unnamed protein product, partial [Pylaiella littoralis]
GKGGHSERGVDSMGRTPSCVDKAWSSKNEWPLLRLKEKAFVMGRDHLDLKSMAEEVEAAAALDGITEALDRWDRQSHHAAMKGELSPLPPIEALRKLLFLVTDNNSNDEDNGCSKFSQACWTLLRRKVLMHL